MTTPNPFNSEDQNSVPAPDAPSFPQASTPGYDQANVNCLPFLGHRN